MAIVQGIKEKVHLPIYDSLAVDGAKQLRDVETTSILKFFVNVQGKTKLETNLQSASLLPHYNTFEARAMRVVISDLPPEFPTEIQIPFRGTDAELDTPIDFKADVQRAIDLLQDARDEGIAHLKVRDGIAVDDDVTPSTDVTITEMDIVRALEADKRGPSQEQISPNDGAGTIIGKIVYNTVTTLYVGEKIMIQMPTWFFPGGAGPYSEHGNFTTHGDPSPMATFQVCGANLHR